MEKYDRVIFVSSDDTCKGPMAEGVMKGLIRGRALTTASRGMVVLFPEPINPKAAKAAERCLWTACRWSPFPPASGR